VKETGRCRVKETADRQHIRAIKGKWQNLTNGKWQHLV